MKTIYIDINCDVGEGVNNETALFPHISSCSIACGGHAGNRSSIRDMLRLSRKYKLKVGAHPAYPDPDNFGRVSLDIAKAELIASIRQQLSLFTALVAEESLYMHHIKAHGALYNDISRDSSLADIYLEAIAPYAQGAVLYVPYNSQIASRAQKSAFSIKYEAFGDRSYNEDLSLVSRTKKGALIESPKAVFKQVLSLVNQGVVTTFTGRKVAILADTICIHGDTTTAVDILLYLTAELEHHKISLLK